MPAGKSELWSAEGDSATLHGVRCSVCSAYLFPPQRFGCPACGARGESLEPADTPASGRLHSFAVVNLHQTHPTPYTIAEVELDAGPVIRARLDDAETPKLNARLAGRVVEDESGAQLVFANAEGNK